jgi:2-polyprenyl-3-methyl-5-hydroxy-6-metoxy-1,4-benzoquinol methylase
MQNSYDHIAEQWHSNLRGKAYVARVLGYVDKILEGLPPKSKVLDLGCGTGDPIARYIAHKGFRVIGVDQFDDPSSRGHVAPLLEKLREQVHRRG